jgi:hypothetical protein
MTDQTMHYALVFVFANSLFPRRMILRSIDANTIPYRLPDSPVQGPAKGIG